MQRHLLLSTLLLSLATTLLAQNTSPYWSLSGNSGTTATALSKLGTTTAIPLNLTTNNITRMRITETGRIGIGTLTPQQPLHVEAPSLLSLFVSTSPLSSISGSGTIGYTKHLPTAAGQRLGYFIMGSRGGGENNFHALGVVGYAGGAWTPGSSYPAYLSFETTPSGSATRAERMRIGAEGNVGIGTTAPATKLHIVDAVDKGYGYYTPLMIYNPNLDTGEHVQIAFGRSNSKFNQAELNFNQDGGVGSANNSFSLGLYGKPAILTLKGTGNVGIGTSTPTTRLEVMRNDGQPIVSRFTNSSTTGDLSAMIEMQSGDSVLWRYGVGGTGNSLGINKGQFYIKPLEGPNGEHAFTITKEGNVGIGTATPEHRLHIIGGIYVFEGSEATRTAIEASAERYGVRSTSDQFGVYAYGNRTGVVGISSYGTGIMGGSEDETGIDGRSYLGPGIQGRSVYSSGVAGSSERGWGVSGHSNSEEYAGVYGSTGHKESSYAGYFNGNVYSTGLYQGSDRKLKQNISDISSAMNIINKLQPKSYEFKQDKNYTLMNLPEGKHFGLIAQDVEEVLPSLVRVTTFDTSMEKYHASLKYEKFDTAFNADAKQTRQVRLATEKLEFKAVNYTEIIPIIVKAMQEQDAENKELKTKLGEMEAKLQKLEALLARNNSTSANISSAYLEQNAPNPSRGATTIRYHIPENEGSARLTLTNAKGQLLKTININGRGTGQLNLETLALSAGIYNYSLWIGGREVDTKKLLITK